MPEEVQTWEERKAEILAPDSPVLAISAGNNNRRNSARAKAKREEQMKHAASRDRLDQVRGLIPPGATPAQDKLRERWAREEREEEEEALLEADALVELQAREAAEREERVKAKADELERKAALDSEKREALRRETARDAR
jgi:hypothetical protein